VNKF